MIDPVVVEDLIKRCKLLYPDDPHYVVDVEAVEKALGVTLPEDLVALAGAYDCGYPGLETFSVSLGPYNLHVTYHTEQLRQAIGLPHQYVVLAEAGESLVVMEAMADRRDATPIIWLDSTDAFRFAEGQTPLSEPTRFSSFTEWFRYLIESEERSRDLQ